MHGWKAPFKQSSVSITRWFTYQVICKACNPRTKIPARLVSYSCVSVLCLLPRQNNHCGNYFWAGVSGFLDYVAFLLEGLYLKAEDSFRLRNPAGKCTWSVLY